MIDKKVTELTELTSVQTSDIAYIVDDPSGIPVSKKTTAQNLVIGGAQDGAVSELIDSNLTPNKVALTDSSGKIINGTATDVEVEYLQGARDNIQYQLDNIRPDNTVPYSCNSGNVTIDGYADIINHESETEVSFKVGGIYENLGVTFPNGKYYLVSEIPNVTGLVDAGTYVFVIYEENLVKLEDGTYSTLATAVKMGYTETKQLATPANAITNYAVDPNYPKEYAFDGDLNTLYSDGAINNHVGHYIGQRNLTEKVTSVTYTPFTTGLINSIKISYSSDNGTNWTDLTTVSISDDSKVTVDISSLYSPSGTYALAIFANANSTGTTSWYVKEIQMFSTVTYTGGNITEGYTYPENQDVSIVPVMTSNTSGGWTASASTLYTGSAYNVSDSSSTSYIYWNLPAGTTGNWNNPITPPYPWVKLLKDTGTVSVNRIAITSGVSSTNGYTPRAFNIRDSNDNLLKAITIPDGVNWLVGETKYFDLDSPATVPGIKIEPTATYANSPGVIILDVKLYTTVTVQDGDLRVFTNQKPLKPVLRNNSVWTEKQFVKLGEATKGAVTLGTPVSYAFNGEYTSGIISVTSSQSYVIPHNIGLPYDLLSNTEIKARENNTKKWREIFHTTSSINNGFFMMNPTTSNSITINTWSAPMYSEAGQGIGTAEYKIHLKRSF